MLRTFRYALPLTIVVLVLAGIIGGPRDAALVGILAILEISLSFDNAVINATVLERMSEKWQRIFLTVGIVIAVFGMRLVFPVAVVAIAGHISPSSVVQLALNHPHQYAIQLKAAHPAIASFGAMFLFMIFADFVFESRDIVWLRPIEDALARVGKLDNVSVIIALFALITVAETSAHDHALQVLVAGASGLGTYLLVNSLAEFTEAQGEEEAQEDAQRAGIHGDAEAAAAPDALAAKVPARMLAKPGLFLFLYLEVLDASFSFDGVVGAFAVTDRLFIIAAGLGVGAMYIRSLTVYLVRRGTLAEYVYLEHGAHYAIGALAVLLTVSITVEVPDIITGLIGVGFIGAALLSSIAANRRRDAEAADAEAAA
ncbi:MAG: uncharacterized protein QOJ11_4242 [Frankiales bacterium]|nr:uncharacterized protein [Frankiales bacterium]